MNKFSFSTTRFIAVTTGTNFLYTKIPLVTEEHNLSLQLYQQLSQAAVYLLNIPDGFGMPSLVQSDTEALALVSVG